jgi:hypothetical protein
MPYLFFGTAVFFGLMAGLLAITKGTFDLWILDHYLLISPIRLLFAAALCAVIAAIRYPEIPAPRP